MSTIGARGGALAVAVTAVVLVAGCGSSSQPAANSTAPPPSPAPSTSTTPTAAAVPGSGTVTSGSPSPTSVAATGFCTALGDYGRKFKTVLAGGQLATVKGQLPPVVAEGNTVAAQAPSTIRGDLGGLAADLSAFNTFVQTTATQQDLDSSTVPPQIAQPLADLQVKGTVVKTWYQDNCHGVFGN